jgi:ATP/maltotriose-dependent transcriptional regulator MalT
MLLVERHEELALLQRQFEDCLEGAGRLVLVTGPVASGKTELLFTFAERATRAGALFLCAAGSNTEKALPLSAIGQLFHGAGVAPDSLDRTAALLLRDGPSDAGSDPAAPTTDQRLAEVLHSVSNALLDLAQRQAMLSALRAEIAMRKGDVAAAREHGRAALEYIPAQSWGVAVGLPLATRLRAATVRGDYEEAVRLLHEPVPESMFQTAFGLLYLHVRGQYYLASGQTRAALDDFRACGSLMSKWGLDLPALVPWRVEAAQAWLRLGNPQRARELANEQLRRLSAGRSRSRAITLRALAATSDVRDRPGLLTEAVDILQSCGDQLELARTLAGRSRVQRELGAADQAGTDAERALQLARDCGAETLVRRLAPERAGPRQPATVEPAPDDCDDTVRILLSDAERRVATLAADGKTNREIARKLFVTVSTVEQHLTRVYRKLKVSRRTDLAGLLNANLANTA